MHIVGSNAKRGRGAELNVYSMIENIEEGREKWIQHIERMVDGRLLHQLYKNQRRGTGDIERPGAK